MLKQMADIASEYVDNTSTGLKCQFRITPTTGELKNYFVEIARSIREDQPTLIRKQKSLVFPQNRVGRN